MSAQELRGIQRIVMFTVLIYVKHWFSAKSECDAPHHDIQLLKTFKNYIAVDNTVAEAALSKFSGHL